MKYMEAIEQHKLMHLNPKIFTGASLYAHIEEIGNIIEEYNVKTILDYGCGKASGWLNKNYCEYLGISKENLYLYDPAYPPYSVFPNKKCDMVICTDVMEHIPEEYIDMVLNTIFNNCIKVVFFNISYKEAKKKLPNGYNAHLTVKDEKWWSNKIKEKNCNIAIKGINFD